MRSNPAPTTSSPWSAVEQRFVDKRGAFPPGRRLGCQAQICGDLVVDVPPESQVHRQVVRKPAEERAIVIDPVVRLHTVAVREPDMREPASDFRRLQEALAEQWGVAGATADLAVLKTLQAALRAGGWTVTVALRNEREIVAISPGFAVNAYGVAVDVGSTTIAAYLCDLSERRGPRLGRRDEPADPLRRGPDEPRVLRDDASGRRRRDDARRARGRSTR